jgi:hypothetical protein
MAESGKDDTVCMAKYGMFPALRKFASSQVRKSATPPRKATPRWMLPVTRNWLHNTLAGSRTLHTTLQNSSEGPREAGLPSEHLRSVGNIALTCLRSRVANLPGRKSRPKPPRRGVDAARKSHVDESASAKHRSGSICMSWS